MNNDDFVIGRLWVEKHHRSYFRVVGVSAKMVRVRPCNAAGCVRADCAAWPMRKVTLAGMCDPVVRNGRPADAEDDHHIDLTVTVGPRRNRHGKDASR